MDPTLFQFYVAIFMVAVIGALFIWFLQSEADASTRRITGMMMRAGLNPGVATLGHRRTGVCRNWRGGAVASARARITAIDGSPAASRATTNFAPTREFSARLPEPAAAPPDAGADR